MLISGKTQRKTFLFAILLLFAFSSTTQAFSVTEQLDNVKDHVVKNPEIVAVIGGALIGVAVGVAIDYIMQAREQARLEEELSQLVHEFIADIHQTEELIEEARNFLNRVESDRIIALLRALGEKLSDDEINIKKEELRSLCAQHRAEVLAYFTGTTDGKNIFAALEQYAIKVKRHKAVDAWEDDIQVLRDIKAVKKRLNLLRDVFMWQDVQKNIEEKPFMCVMPGEPSLEGGFVQQ